MIVLASDHETRMFSSTDTSYRFASFKNNGGTYFETRGQRSFWTAREFHVEKLNALGHRPAV